MFRTFTPLAMAVALGFAWPAAAATKQKPGLWETTIRVDLGDSMPQIPPHMLEQMRGAGFELPFAEPVIHRVCLLPEQVAQDAVPEFSDPDSGCATRNTIREGDQFSGQIACNGRLRGQGTLQMNLTSSESYVGSTDFNGVAEDSLPVTLHSDFSGRWLGTDCGDVPSLGS
jgi:hypothetical protein